MLISPYGVPVSGGGVCEVSVSRNCGGDIFQSQGHVRAKKNSRSWQVDQAYCDLIADLTLAN